MSFEAKIAPYATPHEPDPTLLAVWRGAGIANDNDGTGDIEDWTEMAARLQIAVDNGMHLSIESGHADHREPGTPIWGPLSVLADAATRQQVLAEDYCLTEAFANPRISGRVTVLTDPARFCHTVALFGAGKRIWFKARTAKKYLGVLDFTGYASLTADDVRHVLAQDVYESGWMLVSLSQAPGAIMVYEHVTMEYEYRFFVIDGKLVTGAGCIEEHTPVSNTALFDPFTRRIRSDHKSEAPVARPDVVSAYRGFITDARVLEAFADEGLTTYVMDVAMGDDGPLVIELNGVLNAGLYACDTAALGAAIAAAPQDFIAIKHVNRCC